MEWNEMKMVSTHSLRAQWEATYFRKKWQQKQRENGSKDGNTERVSIADLEPKNVPISKSPSPTRNRKRAMSARPRVKRPSSVRRRTKRSNQSTKSRVRRSDSLTVEEAECDDRRRRSVGVAADELRSGLVSRSGSGSGSGTTSSSALTAIRRELAAKQSVLDSLTVKYREMAHNLSADRVIQKRALLQCERYKEMLRQKEEEKESECLECSALRTERDSLRLFLGNLQSENRSMENRIGRLTAHSVLGDELESERMAEMRAVHGERVKALQSELRQREDEGQRLRDGLRAAERERDGLREEVAALKAENAAMATKQRVFDKESGVDPEDLECALDLIERSKTLAVGSISGSKWKGFEGDDGVSLRAKIDELQIERRDLVLECTQNQNLLESQIDLNKKLERDLQRISMELDRHQKHREFTVPINEINDIDIGADEEWSESISHRTTENVLSLNVSHCELETAPNSLSLLIVDFLHFDSIRSPKLIAGDRPKFDLHCRFTLKFDRFLLHSLSADTHSDTDTNSHSDPLRIHFVQKQTKNGNTHCLRVTATASISPHSLRRLLFHRQQQPPTDRVRGHKSTTKRHQIDLISNDGQNRVIGALFFSINLLRTVILKEDDEKEQNQ